MLGLQEILNERYDGLNLMEDGLFKAIQGLTSVAELINLASE